MRVSLLLAVAGITLLVAQADADIYHCPDGQGGMVFTNQPCAGAPTAPVIVSPPRPLSPVEQMQEDARQRKEDALGRLRALPQASEDWEARVRREQQEGDLMAQAVLAGSVPPAYQALIDAELGAC
jgi:hypothetical protein